MKNKAQRVNQHNGCHTGSFRANSKPETYKSPDKQTHRFFSRESKASTFNQNLDMNVAALILMMKINGETSRNVPQLRQTAHQTSSTFQIYTSSTLTI